MIVLMCMVICLLTLSSAQEIEEDTDPDKLENYESFFSSMDFQVVFFISNSNIPLYQSISQSIIIGVAGFWGGVFCMGLLYLLAVLTKRVFKPEEAEKIAE